MRRRRRGSPSSWSAGRRSRGNRTFTGGPPRAPNIRRVQGLLEGRLGLALAPEAWPSTATLKGWQAAGFAWAQVGAPPVAVLRDRVLIRRHADALRRVLDATGLRLVVVAPPDLRAGKPGHDAALTGVLEHAAWSGAEIVVYAACDLARTLPAALLAERLALEERALRAVAETARVLGVRLALRNLAPAYPGAPHVGHDPASLAALADRIGGPALRLCADIGHAHVCAALDGRDVADLIGPALERAALVCVHDNFGARPPEVAGVDPLRLDLHLPPGRGTVPWSRLAAALAGGPAAPVIVDLHGARADPVALASETAALLAGRDEAAAAA